MEWPTARKGTKEISNHRRGMKPKPLVTQSMEGIADPRRGDLGVRCGAMAGSPACGEFEPDQAFFGDLNGIESLPANVQRISATFVERIFGANEVRMMCDEIGTPVFRFILFIGYRHKDEIATQRQSLPLGNQHCHEIQNRFRLHVERATAPNVSIGNGAVEWRIPPLRCVGWDHIDVRSEEQWTFVAIRGEPTDQIGPRRRGFEDDGRTPFSAQDGLKKTNRLDFIPRRIRGVDTEELLQVVGCLVKECVPFHGHVILWPAGV